MTGPEWTRRHLHAGERVLWSQDIPRGAAWMILGPLVGAGFALAFAGPAVTNLEGPWDWLVGGVPERLGVAPWLLTLAGAIGFVSLVAKHAIVHALTAWVVTDRRVVRAVRFAPWLGRSWSIERVELQRVKLKREGSAVSFRVPARWGTDTLTIEARERGSLLVGALRRRSSSDGPVEVEGPAGTV